MNYYELLTSESKAFILCHNMPNPGQSRKVALLQNKYFCTLTNVNKLTSRAPSL